MITRRTLFQTLLGYNAFLLNARSQGTSRAPKLKIREVRAVRIRNFNSRFVRVYTEEGLTGTGEFLDTVGAEYIVNENLGPALAGRDPLDIEGIYLDYWGWKRPPGGNSAVFMRGMGGPYLAALSGIEMALWDLAGKAMGVPIYRLLGGRVRDKIAVYFHARDPKTARQLAADTGVKAIKFGIDYSPDEWTLKKGWDPDKTWNLSLNLAQIDDIAALTAGMREALGKEYGLAVECHTRYDTESAIQLAKAIEPYRPLWLEEPIPSDNVEAMAKVRAATRIPIAAGENIYTRYGYRPFLEKQALSIIQPDMAKCGGLLESRKIASMAEIYHIPIAPHGVATTLGKIAFTQVCATVPNFLMLEWAHWADPLYDGLTQPASYSAGYVQVPDRPGIGIEVNEDAVRERLDSGFKPL